MAGEPSLIPVEQIERAILVIRRQKVMLDADLAGLKLEIANCDIKLRLGRAKAPTLCLHRTRRCHALQRLKAP